MDEWPEIIETAVGTEANKYANAKNPDGSYMYNKPQYDVDRHVYVLIKARARKVKEAV